MCDGGAIPHSTFQHFIISSFHNFIMKSWNHEMMECMNLSGLRTAKTKGTTRMTPYNFVFLYRGPGMVPPAPRKPYVPLGKLSVFWWGRGTHYAPQHPQNPWATIGGRDIRADEVVTVPPEFTKISLRGTWYPCGLWDRGCNESYWIERGVRYTNMRTLAWLSADGDPIIRTIENP